MGKPDPDASLWGHMDRTLHRGEVPRTRFLDIEEAKKVTVLSWPGMYDHLANFAEQYAENNNEPSMLGKGEAAFAATFAKTCHATEPVNIAPHETLASVLEAAAGGSLLWQNAETFYYGLRLEGLTRVLSHQLVRARVGWSFSETCTGDHDWRDGDFLVPRAWQRDPHMLERRIAHMLTSKMYYAADIDGRAEFSNDNIVEYNIGRDAQIGNYRRQFDPGIPNDARYILHPALKVFVHVKVNLAALKEWYAKRSCTATQAWEMCVLAEKVKEAVLAVTPWAKAAFQRPCDAGKCWYLGAYKQPLAMANYYRPDEVHAKFMDDWNPKSFLSEKTHFEASSGPTPFVTREYVGYERKV